ncbi:SigE family RNA polymerase sigma factor [Nocardioides marinquilinus]|uniref:SigE family RNA polymerase sigma factor n=1 Tax=Nocardioides marinquilinus TaxID=1210400 RepID=A0ABP9PG73_9ACTN
MTARSTERDREFEEFVLAAWPRLRRAAYLLAHDAHEAEDLVQTALARSYARWGRVRREGAYSYVHRALVNAYIDTGRRRRPTPSEHLPDAGRAADTSVEDRSELVELLAPLSPRERAIVVLRYYLDTPEKDVAHRLGVSPGTVRSTASRALARLREAHDHTDRRGTQR